jgi:hypothetical protein
MTIQARTFEKMDAPTALVSDVPLSQTIENKYGGSV